MRNGHPMMYSAYARAHAQRHSCWLDPPALAVCPAPRAGSEAELAAHAGRFYPYR